LENGVNELIWEPSLIQMSCTIGINTVPITWLAVRPMRHKWASCSTGGQLHFSTDLLPLDPQLWDYVIVHELLHLSVPNHGRLWKALMRAHLGDWEASSERLQQAASRCSGSLHPCR